MRELVGYYKMFKGTQSHPDPKAIKNVDMNFLDEKLPSWSISTSSNQPGLQQNNLHFYGQVSCFTFKYSVIGWKLF